MQDKPITLITGARQVGKTTLCKGLVRKYGYEYVSLMDPRERFSALEDPDMFLRNHKSPLIIDEVQYAPGLFDSITAVIDEAAFAGKNNKGMYVLAGSQAYNLMEGVTQSMAGRVGIINMSPFSVSEIQSRTELPFQVDFENNLRRCRDYPLDVDEFYKMLVRGMYPEIQENSSISASVFYSDYVDSYIARDVSQLINLKDQRKFLNFMELIASLTGQELVYNRIANDLNTTVATVQSWLGVLVAGDIVHLLQPYFERSTSKRIVKRPKIYFSDTGLACYLAKIIDAESLRAGYLKGPMVETFIINEILKSYKNNRASAGFYYYRDSDMNEIDLIIQMNGKISLIECKSGMTYDKSDIKAFDRLRKSDYGMGQSCIICLTDRPYPISQDVYVLPITAI